MLLCTQPMGHTLIHWAHYGSILPVGNIGSDPLRISERGQEIFEERHLCLFMRLAVHAVLAYCHKSLLRLSPFM